MPQLVVLNLGTGDLYSGLPRVTAQVWAGEHPRPEQLIGSLPVAPTLAELYGHWRSLYQSLCDCQPLRSVIKVGQEPMDDPLALEVDESGITHVSEISFEELCHSLQNVLNAWLRSDTFLPIERHLRSQFHRTEAIRIVIETDDDQLRRLPWERWEFFKDYPRAEVALSCPEYQCRGTTPRTGGKKARILAILGSSQGIDVAQEAQFLQQLTDAETQFLINPSRQEFNQQLWAKPGWDMLFFAGHSQTEGATGRIYINENPSHNSLTIAQFEAAIEAAVSNGLKLAIFNSCDGLGLATALGCLHMPQVIVMREPVANRVAQEFFKYFLEAFARQHLSLHLSVRQARRQLQGLENEFPGASWLPVLCQNPAMEPSTWQDWCDPTGGRQRLAGNRIGFPVLWLSFIITIGVLGMRWFGWLQPWELQAFDQLLRLRPPESPDQRLLVITINEADLHLPEQAQGKGSLSDLALAKLLQILIPLKPRAIGLDVYRDFPLNPLSTQLATNLKRQPSFFAICKVDDPEGNFPEIAPMPNLSGDRQGFSDVVIDADTVLRRHLLLMDQIPGSLCSTPYALSTQLAFHYLKAEGITPHYTAEGNLQLGNQVFQPLRKHVGSYHQADTAGYQILLNYRLVESSLSPAPTIALKAVLAGRLKPEDVSDRVVLIGVTAPSSKDFLATPYGQRIPGVLIQAQMVSQLISAVKDGRAPISIWTWQAEIVWIWGWAVVGGVFGWRCRSVFWLLVLQFTALGTLSICCFYGLTQSQWMPLVPAAIGMLITNASVIFIVTHDEHKSTQTSPKP